MSNSLKRQIQRRSPMAVPAIGAQQPPFDVKEAAPHRCDHCSGELFEKLYRIGFISEFASKNRTRQKVTVEYPVYVCYSCGCEIGKTSEKQ